MARMVRVESLALGQRDGQPLRHHELDHGVAASLQEGGASSSHRFGQARRRRAESPHDALFADRTDRSVAELTRGVGLGPDTSRLAQLESGLACYPDAHPVAEEDELAHARRLDRQRFAQRAFGEVGQRANVDAEMGAQQRQGGGREAVSYTHLTLPTIYSV